MHMTAKDFRVEWFSGTGKGGQHRNKHQNCCRITHKESGISAIGTSARSRVTNQRDAFNVLARRLIAQEQLERLPERVNATEVIRNYHKERNEVKDNASGLRLPYTEVVEKANLGRMIEARKANVEAAGILDEMASGSSD